MGYGAGKGGCKGFADAPYDKGFGKGKRPKGPSGPDLERERLTAEKFTGEVAFWRGKFGYIMPSEPIDHPAAEKKGGKLWASMADILSGATELAEGQQVSFHVYSDSSGILGAEEIEEDGEPPAMPKATKGAGKGFSKGVRPPVSAPAPYGAPKGKACGKSAKAPWQAPVAEAPWSAGVKGKGKGKDKGKDKGKSKFPAGPDLQRERLTAEKFTGEVVEWKGKFGYVKPDEEVDHPNAKKKEGKLWVSVKDIDGDELTVGQSVSFHIYTDASGILGADEVE